MALDPALIGEWKRGNKNDYQKFEADGAHFSGTHDTPYWIESGGSVLNINNKTFYQRQSSEQGGIVGHWRDDPNGEDIYFRADGRSISVFDDEKCVYTGTFSYTPTHISGYAYTSVVETTNGVITYHLPFRLPESAPYSISGDQLTIGTGVYTKLPERGSAKWDEVS